MAHRSAISEYLADIGRKGGAVTGASKRRGDAGHYAALAESYWQMLTPEERSREMSRRRRKKGTQKKE